MARRRRKRGTHPVRNILVVVVCVGAVTLWWLHRPDGIADLTDPTATFGSKVALTSNRPDGPSDNNQQPGISEKGTPNRQEPPAAESQAITTPHKVAALIRAGQQALTREDVVAARTHFNEAAKLGVAVEEAAFLRAELTRLGNETIFSSRLFAGDPHVGRHVIQPGETLAKIAKQSNISADLLASINHIQNKNRIRAGRSIKIIRGPFRAEVNTKTFTMDVYLDHTLVRSYKVGLGKDDSTPRGTWRVGTKLKNPTYYPPRGGDIIAADDPRNPLGERWIGLVGVSGEALGQERYGIHGTRDPDSIGTTASMGCIRMYNEDVEALYTFLVEKLSSVTIR